MATKWIEKVEPVIALPADPQYWQQADVDALLAALNTDALRAMVAAALAVVDAQETKEGVA